MNGIKNKDLKKRIIEISYKYKLSHLGSCLTAVDIIDDIFSTKESDEHFILSSGHAGLALYVVLEKYSYYYKGSFGHSMIFRNALNAEEIFNHHGVHPDRCEKCHIDCSSGSLGNGLPIAVGMALGNKTKNVYCLISDGECAEGSIWEALRIKQDNNISNLHVLVNINGWAAYQKVNNEKLMNRLYRFSDSVGAYTYGLNILTESPKKLIENNDLVYFVSNMDEDLPPFLKGQAAHYHVMTDEEYAFAINYLS